MKNGNVGEMRAVRPIVWPAYVVAACAVLVAIALSIVNTSLNGEAHQAQLELAQMNAHTTQLNRELEQQRTELTDLLSPDSQRYPVDGGTVLRHGSRLYLAMDALPVPPKGKVYQAWTTRAGATQPAPSVLFVPSTGGVAVVPIPGDALKITEVEVTIEPDGGSKTPTSEPTFVLKLS